MLIVNWAWKGQLWVILKNPKKSQTKFCRPLLGQREQAHFHWNDKKIKSASFIIDWNKKNLLRLCISANTPLYKSPRLLISSKESFFKSPRNIYGNELPETMAQSSIDDDWGTPFSSQPAKKGHNKSTNNSSKLLHARGARKTLYRGNRGNFILWAISNALHDIVEEQVICDMISIEW